LTLAQLIDFLEEDDFSSRPDVFILPPDNGNETEADSDESHDEHLGNINHLPRGILNQSFEIQEEFESDDEDFLTLAELQRRLKGKRK
jgi:hypothetical protein